MVKRKIINAGKKLMRETLFWGLAIVLAVVLMNKLFPTKRAEAQPAALSFCGNIFYGDTTNAGVMRSRTFNASAGVCTSTWGTEFNGISGSASNILHVVAKTAPTREEMMIGSLRVNGDLQIESCTTGCDANADFTSRWNHASVSATQDCDSAPTAGTCIRPFDIGYESRSGRALVVYAGDGADAGTVTDDDLVYYAFWNGSSWSPNSTPGTPGTSNEINLPNTAGTPRWIRVIPDGENLDKDRSNRMIVLVADSNDDLFAFYWDGSSFDSGTTLETNLENCSLAQCFDGAWQDNNNFIVAYADNDGTSDVKYRLYTVGTGWGSETQAFTTATAGQWIMMAASPTSTRVMLTTSESGDDARNAIWRANDSTNGWTVCNVTDCPDLTTETVNGRQSAGVFERLSGEGLYNYNDAGTTATGNFFTYTPTSTWGTKTRNSITTSDDTLSMNAWTNPNSGEIMLIVADVDCDTYAAKWTGSSFSTAAADLEAANSMYGTTCPELSAPGTDPGGAAFNYDFTWRIYTPWQRNWRFFPGTDTASTPSTGTALAAENTAPTGIVDGQDIRLRINYAEKGRNISNNDDRKKLQYTSGCNPETSLESSCTWTDVDDPGGAGIWRYVDITCTPTDCADGTVLTGTVLTGSSTCSAGLGCGTWVLDKDAAAGANMDHTAQSTADTIQESEWIIEPNGATGGTTYYFRIYDVDQDTPIYTEESADNCGAGSSDCSYPSLTMLKTDQLNYRWRNDDGAENAGTSLVAQDTALSGMVKNTNYRLRFLVNVTGGNASGYNFRLEWAVRNGASCDSDESYSAVPDTPTTEPFDMVATANYVDGANSTNVTTGAGVITDPSGTFTAGKLVESPSNSTGSLTINSNNFTEIEYALQANNNASGGGNYCLRVSNSGTPLTTYSQYAAVQIEITGPTTDQILRHGNWFSGDVEQGFFWADIALARNLAGSIFGRNWKTKNKN